MSRNKSVKQRLDGEQHYDELESDIDEKASERYLLKRVRNFTDDYI